MKRLVLLLAAACMTLTAAADEGMWLLPYLQRMNIKQMKERGCKLSAEEIYSVNHSSLKDAVVIFGGGCTGEIVSPEGLLFTNHHCGYASIQSLSSVEHDYLKYGFWAMSNAEELPAPGLEVRFVRHIADVTADIVGNVPSTAGEEEYDRITGENIAALKERLQEENPGMEIEVKSFFGGNQYFAFVMEVYTDVRLVGTPPSSIGKFGGDTDNWMWPRHTGDFSVLRIYAGKDNEPAPYSPDNQPYKPATFFKISTKGVHEGDFTMVFGYPGTTKEYLTSYAVEQIQEIENPNKIAIRTAKLNIINAAMESDELLRIKYASKAASVANAWKKWQGEVKGLNRFNTVETKQQEEKAFRQWAAGKPAYANLLDRYQSLYAERKDLVLAQAYLSEAGMQGAEIVSWSARVYNTLNSEVFQKNPQKVIEKIRAAAQEFYKDYDTETDRKILVEMLKLYNENLPAAWVPAEVQAAASKGVEAYVAALFKKSVFASEEAFNAFISKANDKSCRKLEKDPAYSLYASIYRFNADNIAPKLSRIANEIKRLDEAWLAALMEMQPERHFYADANSTLRVAYGKVQGYAPCDAVYYKHFTTLNGIMEKDNPEIYDYDVPQRLREIYEQKDFGNYTQEGEVPVCFIATNHTTGGNSGSPVLNAEGHLIGINFDRAWDGVMSDIQYNTEICRNISVDIRYVLFVIDKVAGASHLIDEMVLVD